MTIQEILDLTWVPILAFGVSLGVGLNLLITKDPKILRGKKDTLPYKDSEKYAYYGGLLMLFLALGSLIMVGLLFYNAIVATIESVVVIVVFAVIWKKIHTLYGPV